MKIKLTDGTTAIVSDDFKIKSTVLQNENDLTEKTKKELMAMAEAQGLEIDSKVSKDKIIELLTDDNEKQDAETETKEIQDEQGEE